MNYSLLCDFYELTMANGYLQSGMGNQIAYFDFFFRRIPDDGGFAITAGLEQVLEYIEYLRFTESDIEFLRRKRLFSENFLDYLRSFKFTGDLWAVPDGTPVFPYEPVITVRAPVIEAQFIETFLLLSMNHQSLIATKANRIVRAAQGRPVLEFGARRAHGADSAVLGARAAYIGGCAGTSCTISDRDYGVPAAGTMAHSWVQMFDSEYEAFRVYCETYPENTTLLVDTYDTLKSGIPNAIRAFKDVLVPKGIEGFGIRLDSGDLSSLTKEARRMLDDVCLQNCKIVASNSLDERSIDRLLADNAPIDVFGVGERLITAQSDPIFGGVYKLAAIEDGGEIVPRIKRSEMFEKTTNPHYKTVYRIFDKHSGKAAADIICLHDEKIEADDASALSGIIDDDLIKGIHEIVMRKLPIQVIYGGQIKTQKLREIYSVYEHVPTDIRKIRQYCIEQIEALDGGVKRLTNPDEYPVLLSTKLADIKRGMLESIGNPG